MLDHRMRDAFVQGVAERAALPDVEAPVTPGAGGEHTVSAGLPHRAGAPPGRRRDRTTRSWRSASARSPSSRATTPRTRSPPCSPACRATSPPPSRSPRRRPTAAPPELLAAAHPGRRTRPGQRLADRCRRRPRPAPRRPLPGHHLDLHLGRRHRDRALAAPGQLPVDARGAAAAGAPRGQPAEPAAPGRRAARMTAVQAPRAPLRPGAGRVPRADGRTRKAS